MALRIMDDTMTLEIDNPVVVTARFSEHAAADGNGAWIVSTHSARLFTRDQAITALTGAELRAKRVATVTLSISSGCLAGRKPWPGTPGGRREPGR